MSDKHWLVTVESHGETLVTIESEGMGGKDNLTEGELKLIRTAAEHLLAFAGEAGEGFEVPEDNKRLDNLYACPDCKANMVKIGIDAYRCTRCGEKFTAYLYPAFPGSN